MEIIGTITNVQPVAQGTSQAGKPWSRQTIVLKYGEQYPKEVAISLLNDNITKFANLLKVGVQLKVSFDVSSREFNGRYYTECIAWKIEQPYAQPAYQQPAYQQPQPTAYQQAQQMYNQQYPPQQPPFGQPAPQQNVVAGTDELPF